MWKTSCCLVLALAATGLSFGQVSTLPAFPDFIQPYTELKTYLNLSDAQVQSLRDVQTQRSNADQAIYRQISERQQALNSLLQANSTDITRIGQLMVDINRLQKQVPTSGEPYRSQALNVLNPDQKAKLPSLVTALQLQSPASQAAGLNLIDGPQYRILPAATGSISGVLLPAPVNGPEN
jgi:hypothetical protein